MLHPIFDFTYCASHDPDNTRRRRFGERVARDCLAKAFPEEDGRNLVWDTAEFGGDHSNRLDCIEEDMSSKYRPDFIITNDSKYPGRVVYVEHDENQHRYYNVSCDAKRTCEIIQWKTHDCPMLVARVNPDSYKTSGGRKKITVWRRGEKQDSGIIRERYQQVVQDAMQYFEMPLDDLVHKPNVAYNLYYYDNHTDNSPVQRFYFEGPEIDESGMVVWLKLNPL